MFDQAPGCSFSTASRSSASLASHGGLGAGYPLLRTRYCRRLYGGHGYAKNKSFRSSAAASLVLLLRVAVLIMLGLALPAQAHGMAIADPETASAQR